MNGNSVNISLSLDGDQYCALIGKNLQEGIAGFGDSPAEALKNLADEVAIHKKNMQQKIDAKILFDALIGLQKE